MAKMKLGRFKPPTMNQIMGKNKANDYSGETQQRDRALNDAAAATDQFSASGPGHFERGEDLSPAEQLRFEQMGPAARQGQSGMAGISTDPLYKQHEMAALRELEDQSQNGFTARDRADMQRTENQVNKANKGRIASIMQNQQARGMGGGGMDLMAQLQSSQDSNEIAAMRALEQEGMMQDRKSAATMNLGSMSSQLQNRDFSQEAQKAAAQDRINQFNTENTNTNNRYNNAGINNANQANWGQANQTREANWNRTNQTNDRNADAKYTFGRDMLNAKTAQSGLQYNAATDAQAMRMQQEEARKRRRAGAIQGVLGAGGAIAGGIIGSAAGPQGAMAGASIGGAAGSGIGGGLGAGIYGAHGGGGIAWGSGHKKWDEHHFEDTQSFEPEEKNQSVADDYSNPVDDYAKDKQVVVMNPKEVLLPESVSTDPEKAKDFVQGLKDNPDNASVEQRNTVYDRIMQSLGKIKPDLIEAFRAKHDGNRGVKEAENDLDDAKHYENIGKMTDIGGNILTDYVNSQNSDLILPNRMEDLGKRHQTIAAHQQKWHDLAPGLEKDTNRAQDDLFKYHAIEQKKADAEARLQSSKAAEEGRILTANILMWNNLTKEQQALAMQQMKQAGMTFEQGMKTRILDNSENTEEAKQKRQQIIDDDNRKNTADDLEIKKGHLKVAQSKLKIDADEANRKAKEDKIHPLSGEALKRFDDTEFALTGVRNVANAIASKKFTKDQMLKIPGRGDTEFTLARKTYEQGMIRLQSGGAATPIELKDLGELQPEMFDSREMMLKKSNQMINILSGIQKRIKNNQQGEAVKTNKELLGQYVIFTDKSGRTKKLERSKVTPAILEDAKNRGMKVSR